MTSLNHLTFEANIPYDGNRLFLGRDDLRMSSLGTSDGIPAKPGIKNILFFG
jgi:hypothetical protein